MKISKTNAARILDAKQIGYELVPYRVDEGNLAAGHIAEQLGENIEQVFKTLVLRGDKTGLFVCVIPGNKEVDLKKAARVSGNKKAEMYMGDNETYIIQQEENTHNNLFNRDLTDIATDGRKNRSV